MNSERRVAIVSGGSRGLGEAVVAELLGSGAIVATFSRSATPGIDQRRGDDPQAESFYWEAVDGADFERVQQFALGVARRYGRIDFLVNNMAVGSDGLLDLDAPTPTFIARSRLNLEATILLTRACLKAMLAERSARSSTCRRSTPCAAIKASRSIARRRPP